MLSPRVANGKRYTAPAAAGSRAQSRASQCVASRTPPKKVSMPARFSRATGNEAGLSEARSGRTVPLCRAAAPGADNGQKKVTSTSVKSVAQDVPISARARSREDNTVAQAAVESSVVAWIPYYAGYPAFYGVAK